MEITLDANFLAIENDELELINGGLTAEQWASAICWAAGTLIGAAIAWPLGNAVAAYYGGKLGGALGCLVGAAIGSGFSWIFGKLC